MSFFGSVFGGQNKILSSDIGAVGNAAAWATGQGQTDIGAGSNFSKSILSGDPTQISKALAPQIGAIQGQTQQNLNTTAQFGNRSGGNNASNQAAKDTATGQLNSLVGSLMGGAANNLTSTGLNLTQQGAQNYMSQAQLSQQQMENWSNSILGLGLTQGAGFLEGFGLSKIPGASGGSGSNN